MHPGYVSQWFSRISLPHRGTSHQCWLSSPVEHDPLTRILMTRDRSHRFDIGLPCAVRRRGERTGGREEDKGTPNLPYLALFLVGGAQV
jgi:hypothetical protein